MMNKYTNTPSPLIGPKAQSRHKLSKIMGITAAGLLALNQSAIAGGLDDEPALLVIGASNVNGNSPINYINGYMVPVLGGVAVNAGSYLSLGDALIRTPELPGFVINEGQAGATTFDRLSCVPGPTCGPGWWTGFDKQFDRALMRVAVRDPQNPLNVLYFNADYVVIGIPNDCLHSGAFDVPQTETQPCSSEEFNGVIDRIIAVGQRALDLGITPIYNIAPECSEEMGQEIVEMFGLLWWIDVEGCNEYRDLYHTRIAAELPDALLVDAWRGYTTLDSLHPNRQTAIKTAHRIARAIKQHRNSH